MIINIDKFQKDLKIKFRNKSLLIEAFTHKNNIASKALLEKYNNISGYPDID